MTELLERRDPADVPDLVGDPSPCTPCCCRQRRFVFWSHVVKLFPFESSVSSALGRRGTEPARTAAARRAGRERVDGQMAPSAALARPLAGRWDPAQRHDLCDTAGGVCAVHSAAGMWRHARSRTPAATRHSRHGERTPPRPVIAAVRVLLVRGRLLLFSPGNPSSSFWPLRLALPWLPAG